MLTNTHNYTTTHPKTPSQLIPHHPNHTPRPSQRLLRNRRTNRLTHHNLLRSLQRLRDTIQHRHAAAIVLREFPADVVPYARVYYYDVRGEVEVCGCDEEGDEGDEDRVWVVLVGVTVVDDREGDALKTIFSV